jgi:hypothetical protein
LNLSLPGLKLKKLLCWIIASIPLFVGAQALDPSPVSVPAVSKAVGKLEVTLAQLRDRLVLKPEQQALWIAYAGKVNAYAEVFYREKPVLASQETTALQQVGRLVDSMQNRLAALEDVEIAAKNLYASLSSDQQKIANQLLVATLPSFTSYAPNTSGESKRSAPKPESGSRQHRGGGMGGMGGG